MNAPATALSPETPFIPPAYVAPAVDPSPLLLAARSPANQVEGWPRAMFEADTYRPPFPGTPVFVMQPQAVRTVLLEAAADFPRGALFARMMRPAWGQGLLLAEGPAWRMQRQAAAHAFRAGEMVGLTPLISRAAEARLDQWRREPPPPRLDIAPVMTDLTFDIILDTMLSGGEDFNRPAMVGRLRGLLADISRMRLSYFLAPDAHHANRPDLRSSRRAALISDLTAMVARRRNVAPRGDLIDLLLKARDPETGQGLDDALLADNLLGFILAGHETTALALTWSLYLTAAHPPTAGRIREEVAAVAGTAPIAAEHVPGLVFTRQVVSEALRLYPPAYLLTRVCQKDCDLAGRRVAAGTRVNVPIYALHRHRLRWSHPDSFDPDRFAPDAPAPDRYAYMPFGAGPRICIGSVLAMLESVVVLASLLRGARFSPDPTHRVWPVAGLALRPRGGMPMRVEVAAVSAIAHP